MSPHLVRILTITARHWALPWRVAARRGLSTCSPVRFRPQHPASRF